MKDYRLSGSSEKVEGEGDWFEVSEIELLLVERYRVGPARRRTFCRELQDMPPLENKQPPEPESISNQPELSQLDFEIEFYGRILQRSPNYVDVVRRQAELLSRQGRCEEALMLDRRLVDLAPTNCVAHYNLGCSLSRNGRLSEAIEAIEKAIVLGYIDFDHLETDSDLEPLHEIPAFQALLRRCGR